MISDLCDDVDKIVSGLKHFKFKGHELIVFHILDPQELLLRIKNIIKMSKDPNILSKSKIGNAELNLNKMTIKLNEKLQKICKKRKINLIEDSAHSLGSYYKNKHQH